MSAVGIDIGNSKCTIAAVVNRNVEILLNDMSNRSTPTLVAFGPKKRTFGEAAKVQEISNLKNTIGCLKRILGLSLSQIMESEGRFLFNNSISESNGQVYITVAYKGQQVPFTPLQLMAGLLAGLKETAELAIGAETVVKNCVLTIPAYYTELQTRLLEQAASLAGLTPFKLQRESSAIALEYGIYRNNELDEKEPRIVLFMDVGQSASTATVVSYLKGRLEIKGVACDAHFGGRNIDLALFDSLVGEFNKRHGIDICSNPKAVSRLMAACERAKKILSANSLTNLNVESIMNDIDVCASVSRQDLEALCAPMFPKLGALVASALEMAAIPAEAVHFVELCGSSCRVPAIKEAIGGFFAGKPAQVSVTLNFEEAVARGATMQCAAMSPSFRVREFAIKELVSRPIIAAYDASEEKPEDTGCVLFAQGSFFPAVKEMTFKQRSKEFTLSFAYGDTNELLSTYKLPACKADGGKLKVRVKMNANGIVFVEGAQWLGEKIVQEVVAEPTTEGKADAAKEPSDQKTPRTVEKKVVTSEEAPVVGGFVLPGLASPSQLTTFAQVEQEIITTELLVRKTEDKKNAVENYIYEMRSKLEGELAAFAQEKEQKALSSLLEETQNWLYEQGEDATFEEYSKKYTALFTLGEPLCKRHRESCLLTEAFAQFEGAVADWKAKIDTAAWMAPEERVQALAEIASRAEKVQSAVKKQASLKPWDKPQYIAADVQCERVDLNSALGPMLQPKVVEEEGGKCDGEKCDKTGCESAEKMEE